MKNLLTNILARYAFDGNEIWEDLKWLITNHINNLYQPVNELEYE